MMLPRITTAVLTGLLIACAVDMSAGSELRKSARVRAVERAMPSVVNIHTEKPAYEKDSVFSSGKGRKINGMGTGVVVDERGYIVTNFHVIADVDLIRTTFHDRTQHTARVVAFDKEHDLALIKIDAGKPLPVIAIGTSSDLMLAEDVIAIGNAMGYPDSVSKGIISQLSRDVEANETQTYKNLIQTDAAINPGNSGGPLLNIDGEVIGINVAIRQGAQRIGFAIPIDDVRKISAKLLSVELHDRLWHGAQLKDVKSGMNRFLVVDGVASDSPAAMCGLRPGDVIVKTDLTSIVDAADFERSLLGKGALSPIPIQVRRNDQVETLTITLASQSKRGLGVAELTSANKPVISPVREDGFSEKAWTTLGLKAVPLSTAEKATISAKYKGGLKVTEVKPGSAAAANGIKRGDFLVGLHQFETTSLHDMDWILSQPTTVNQRQLQFLIVRDSQTYFGNLQVAGRDAAAMK